MRDLNHVCPFSQAHLGSSSSELFVYSLPIFAIPHSPRFPAYFYFRLVFFPHKMEALLSILPTESSSPLDSVLRDHTCGGCGISPSICISLHKLIGDYIQPFFPPLPACHKLLSMLMWSLLNRCQEMATEPAHDEQHVCKASTCPTTPSLLGHGGKARRDVGMLCAF